MPDPREPDLVTFAILACNQENVVAEAVKGALSQSYSPLEIIISDDCSTDRTFSVIQSTVKDYTGPHKRIILRRNETNLGMINHINSIMNIANGELIVGAAGDDVSLPHRVDLIHKEYIRSNKRALSIFSNGIIIGVNGNPKGLIFGSRPSPIEFTSSYFVSNLSSLTGCTHAWDRKIFEVFGPMPQNTCAEDMVLPFRSSLLGEIRYIHEPLVLYRENYDRHRNRFDIKVYRTMLRHKHLYLLNICDSWTADIRTAMAHCHTLSDYYNDLLAHVTHMKYILEHTYTLLDINILTRLTRLVNMYRNDTISMSELRCIMPFLAPMLTLIRKLLYLKVRPFLNKSSQV